MERPPSVLSRSSLVAPIVLDVAAVVVFVAVGRDEHQQTSTLADILTVAAPFLIGVAVGSVIAWVRRRDLRTVASGLVVVVVTVVLGLVLRRLVWDRGTAAAFVLVATGFLSVAMIGWRLIGRVIRR